MRFAVRGVLVGALAGVVLTAGPVRAGDGVRREGSCSGSGHWTLRVDRESASRLRVRFAVRDVDEGETWQVFLSDDDVRIFAGSRTANEEGRFRVGTRTRDRTRRDRIEATAVNADTGASCEAALRY
jgi:hypothetical protein